jgi:hypothetical protein
MARETVALCDPDETFREEVYEIEARNWNSPAGA